MNTIEVCPVGTDLASRKSAAQLRCEINAILDAGDRVEVNLSHVQSISESYADELFGILVLSRGLTAFTTMILVRGASDNVLRRVAGAIKERLASSELSGTLQKLVAAKRVNKSPEVCCAC